MKLKIIILAGPYLYLMMPFLSAQKNDDNITCILVEI